MAKTTENSSILERETRTKRLAKIVQQHGLTRVAAKIYKPLGLTVDGTKSAISRTVQGVNTAYNAAKVLNAFDKFYIGQDTNAVPAKKATKTVTAKRPSPNTVGGTLLTSMSKQDLAALSKQAEFVRNSISKMNTNVWRLAEKLYKDMKFETKKEASSRIYRALNLSGYAENVVPVLEYLTKYFSHEVLATKNARPVKIQEPVTKTKTAPTTNKTIDEMLEDIKTVVATAKSVSTDVLQATVDGMLQHISKLQEGLNQFTTLLGKISTK